jgi:NADPH2:quinone reductase
MVQGMKAFLLTRTGPPSVLQPSEVAEPVPRGKQVRVRVQAIGINYAEVLSRRGLYGWAPPRPYVPGMEAFGTIDAVGPESGRRVGEPVIVGTQYGCYGEAICVPEHQALPAIDGFSAEENAAFVVNAMTAWVALVEMARLRPSDTVLVQAAAGGVGTAAVQIARAFGCTVLGGVGSDAKADLVRRLGARRVVNYRQPGWDAALRDETGGRGVDVVFEVVGGDVYARSLGLLAPTGRLVVAGFATYLDVRPWNPLTLWRAWRAAPRVNVRELAMRSNGVLATHIGYLLDQPERLLAIWRALREFAAAHALRPVVGATFAFDEMAKAHALMESRSSTGKIVVRLSS